MQLIESTASADNPPISVKPALGVVAGQAAVAAAFAGATGSANRAMTIANTANSTTSERRPAITLVGTMTLLPSFSRFVPCFTLGHDPIFRTVFTSPCYIPAHSTRADAADWKTVQVTGREKRVPVTSIIRYVT